jgi:hypothetical protein
MEILRHSTLKSLSIRFAIDDDIASIILERTKRFSEGKSKGYTQEEVEKIFGVS